jgi:hypothetical protein
LAFTFCFFQHLEGSLLPCLQYLMTNLLTGPLIFINPLASKKS